MVNFNGRPVVDTEDATFSDLLRLRFIGSWSEEQSRRCWPSSFPFVIDLCEFSLLAYNDGPLDSDDYGERVLLRGRTRSSPLANKIGL